MRGSKCQATDLVPLRDKKLFRPRPQNRILVPLKVLFKISDDHPRNKLVNARVRNERLIVMWGKCHSIAGRKLSNMAYSRGSLYVVSSFKLKQLWKAIVDKSEKSIFCWIRNIFVGREI